MTGWNPAIFLGRVGKAGGDIDCAALPIPSKENSTYTHDLSIIFFLFMLKLLKNKKKIYAI